MVITNMKIAVLSGKGGAGKTFVAVNLASTIGKASYIDCDVEEPNGRLFFKPDNLKTVDVTTPIPIFDENKCNGCRKCVDFCNFNALLYIKNKHMLFNEVCHACGGCELVCPQNAISQGERIIGKVETGKHKSIDVISGVLNTGEASGVKVIEKAQAIGNKKNNISIIDCPPGSACSVMESIADVDYCILVVEPTAFGLHNFKMVYELTNVLNKPCGIIINKETNRYESLYKFCKDNNIDILANIPYDKKIASIIASGGIASEHSEKLNNIFNCIFTTIKSKLGGAVL